MTSYPTLPSISGSSFRSGLTPTEIDELISAIAYRQHGLITTRQLRGLGLTYSAIAKRAHKGKLFRVHQGVYSVGHIVNTERSKWMAAVLATGEDAALSHFAAASLWGVWPNKVRGIEVVVPREIRGHRGFTFHTVVDLTRVDVRVVDGIRVTSVPRTLLDLAERLSILRLAKIVDTAGYSGYVNFSEMDDLITRSKGCRGARNLAAALALYRTGKPGVRSTFEDEFHKQLLDEDIDPPSVNFQVPANGRLIEVDFFWSEAKLVVEVDGPGHRRPSQKLRDDKRDLDLRSSGHTVMRCKPHQFMQTIEKIREVLQQL